MRKDFMGCYTLQGTLLLFFISSCFADLSAPRGCLIVLKNRYSPRLIGHKGMPFVLVICWLVGFLCGAACCAVSSAKITSLMRRVVFSPVSIVGLLNAALIPFLLSAVFVAFGKPWIIAVICFVKAFLFSFVSFGTLVSFGPGGWLLRYILLFCDCLTLPFLIWYWLRFTSVSIRTHQIAVDSVLILLFSAVTALDYRVIAPVVCLIDSTKG